MIRRLAHRWLRAFSQRYDYDTGYMSEILEHSPAVFVKYSTLNLLASHRRGIPKMPWWTARIRAALWEDCGPCVQLVCNMALQSGMDSAVVGAILATDMAVLDEDSALALRFTECVLARDPNADSLRDQVRLRWGEDGLISLAMTISTTRVYPAVKYVLGYGHACQRVNIEQDIVTPATFQSATMPETVIGGTSQ
ncbi:Uncharacterised protein [Halioglobus japonicus]|nr:Uncharacterised protein [Halioglobus japonicus]